MAAVLTVPILCAPVLEQLQLSARRHLTVRY